jgi:hypothetical protein
MKPIFLPGISLRTLFLLSYELRLSEIKAFQNTNRVISAGSADIMSEKKGLIL